MKCPCCSNQVDADMIVLHDTVYMADGTSHPIRLGPARLLKKFLAGQRLTRPPKNSSTFDQYLHMLRESIADLGFPFKIVYEGGYYFLKRNVS